MYIAAWSLCAHVCEDTQTRVWSPEVDARHLSSLFFILSFFLRQKLTETGVNWFSYPVSSQDLPASISLGMALELFRMMTEAFLDHRQAGQGEDERRSHLCVKSWDMIEERESKEKRKAGNKIPKT